MADFNIQPIGTQIRPIQGMSLGDMINVVRGAQAYQQAEQTNPLALQQQQQAARTGQIALSVEEQKDKERRNMQAVMANPSLYTTNGEYDPVKAAKITSEVAPLMGLSYLKDMAGSFGAQETFKTSAIGTRSAEQDFANKQVLGIASRLTSLINNPLIIASEQTPEAIAPEALEKKLLSYADEQARALGIPKERAKELIAPYLAEAKNPAGLRQFLKDKLLTTLDQGSRLSAMQPTGIGINTGAGGATVQTGQFGPYLPGQILPGTAFETQIPPTQQIVTPTGQTQLVGPMSQRGNQPMVTGLGPAQTSLLGAGGASISEDFKTTVKDAAEAQPRIAIFQNIKKFAPESFTGVGGQRKELAAGILNAIGIPAYEQEKVNTEELAKNSALLALAGGNTDAARALAEVATPNKKLNEKAILAIANQMIGIENMKLARANFLTPAQNDAAQYAQKQLQFNQIADPRIFQDMTAEEVAKAAQAMSPKEKEDMLAKIRLARQLGVIR
ncbi:hypothetical protein EBZ39_02140 [bacterium]|nr:hypothetical protein [bacterium]